MANRFPIKPGGPIGKQTAPKSSAPQPAAKTLSVLQDAAGEIGKTPTQLQGPGRSKKSFRKGG